jgi:diacylglycerol kinase (ATP)
MPNRVLICFNPASGKGLSRTILNKFLSYAKANTIDCSVIESSKDVAQLAKLVKNFNLNDFKAVIAIGGDGIVHQLLQILSNSKLGLFVIPAGTGNDFARTNKVLITDPAEVFYQIFNNDPKLIDLGEISYGNEKRIFGQILSTGFDALVNERANRNRFISGQMKYNVATIVELPRFQALSYRIDVDGTSRDLKAMLIAVANGASYGGGMQLAPHANRQDGLLDIMILHPVSKLELIKVFPKVYSGKHVTHPAVEFLKARSISISANSVSYADGERISQLPITIAALPKSLLTWTAE